MKFIMESVICTMRSRDQSFHRNERPSAVAAVEEERETVLMSVAGGESKSSSTKSSALCSSFKFRSNYYYHFGLALLVSLLLPLNVAGREAASPPSSSTIQIVDTIPLEETGRSSSSFVGRSSTADNELLANIDFLTQLTNSKSEKDSEMDALKCFPKALCGLSAESAAITRRRKTGLIADYIRLMKAVSLNPSVMEKTMKKLQNKQKDDEKQQGEEEQDDQGDDSDSEEDEDEEEEEDDDRRRLEISKRTSPSSSSSSTGYGYGTARVKPGKGSSKGKSVKGKGAAPTSATPSSSSSGKLSRSKAKAIAGSARVSKKERRRSKKDQKLLENSNEFTKEYLHERAHVEKLMEDGFYNEETDAQNWWAYENEKEQSLEDLLGDSGSNSVEGFYTFGGKRKPQKPYSPDRPEAPPQPNAPDLPYVRQPQAAPPRVQPPRSPSVRVPGSEGGSGGGGGVAAIGNFFRGLFGFSSGSGQNTNSFTNDAFFQGFQRSMADGTPTLVTVEKTKEILTTAIEIGESLRSPNQCNTLFNGCKYQYVELLHVIDDIRQSMADKGKVDFQTDKFSNEAEADDSNEAMKKVGKRKDNKDRSYGYEANLSATSQAETLSTDYTSAASKVVKKSRRRSGKRGRKSSTKSTSSSSREQLSSEIASDEPTMYGSLGHHIPSGPPARPPPTVHANEWNNDEMDHPRPHHGHHGHGHGHHHDRDRDDRDREPGHRYKDGKEEAYQANQFHYDQVAPQLQHHSYHNSYYSEYLHDKQPKGWWGTFMSWFGFGRKK